MRCWYEVWRWDFWFRRQRLRGKGCLMFDCTTVYWGFRRFDFLPLSISFCRLIFPANAVFFYHKISSAFLYDEISSAFLYDKITMFAFYIGLTEMQLTANYLNLNFSIEKKYAVIQRTVEFHSSAGRVASQSKQGWHGQKPQFIVQCFSVLEPIITPQMQANHSVANAPTESPLRIKPKSLRWSQKYPIGTKR